VDIVLGGQFLGLVSVDPGDSYLELRSVGIEVGRDEFTGCAPTA
jgi:hypothetical protein